MLYKPRVYFIYIILMMIISDFPIVTAAKLTEKSADNEEFAPLPASKLRQRVAAQSASTEKKYAGRKISRSKLADIDSGR